MEEKQKEAATKESGPEASEAVPVSGKVDLETSAPTDTTGEKTGEGDRCDTEEMLKLDNP